MPPTAGGRSSRSGIDTREEETQLIEHLRGLRPARWKVVLAAVGAGVVAAGFAASSLGQPASRGAVAATEIKIGILTTCGGPFAPFEAESYSGAKYALVKWAGGKAAGQSPQNQVTGASVAGHPIKIYFGCSDATPDKAVAEARRLVENVKVDILLGPLSGDEGIAVANYAKTQPGITFVNGTSGAQSTTLSVRAKNFFRFGGDGAQWMAGLGTYAYKKLHWRKAAILGEDYSYPYTLAAGFVTEFCSLGGKVTKRVWAPLTTTDWSSYVSQLPRAVDGTLILTGGSNTISVEKAYTSLGNSLAKKALGGPSVMDPTSFTVGNSLVGLAGGSPVPLGGTKKAWKSYVAGFSKVYPKVPADSLFTVLYYDGMQSIVQALKATRGNLANKESRFRAKLARLRPAFPNGTIRLDGNRNSIQPAYVVQIVKKGNGLGFKTIKTIPRVSQTFGGLFGPKSRAPSRTAPACKKGTPPPWAKSK
jgi:branched-chain amino acid transport system substrate-binding protein